MVNFPLHCVNWIDVNGDTIDHPIEQNAISLLPYIRYRLVKLGISNITN